MVRQLAEQITPLTFEVKPISVWVKLNDNEYSFYLCQFQKKTLKQIFVSYLLKLRKILFLVNHPQARFMYFPSYALWTNPNVSCLKKYTIWFIQEFQINYELFCFNLPNSQAITKSELCNAYTGWIEPPYNSCVWVCVHIEQVWKKDKLIYSCIWCIWPAIEN